MRRALRYLVLCIYILSIVSCGNRKKQNTNDIYLSALLDYVGELEEQSKNLLINDQLVFYGNDSLKNFLLSSLPPEDILFFYFSEQTCIPCINQTIEIITENFPDYTHNEKIIFIAHDIHTRNRDNCYGKRLLTFYLRDIGLPIENLNMPFFFTLNEDMAISTIHFVIKEDFERTALFIKSFACH